MPRTETTTRTLFRFDELSDDAKEKVVEKLWDLNVDCSGWWDSTYEDAAMIGLEITGFDTCRGTIDGDLTESLLDCCKLIRKNHGKDCDTFKTAKQHLATYIEAFNSPEWRKGFDDDYAESHSPIDWLREFSGTAIHDDVTNGFRRELLEDYLSMLRREYGYRTSEEAIIESIQANEHEFSEDGKLA